MSEVYIADNHHNDAHISRTNYTALEDMNNENKIMLDTIIGIFGAIIAIQLLVFSYYFRESIKKFCCARPIRKFDGMVQLGEITHTVEKEEELLEN
tara:strand:- start:451 stop:738 length:288 start_codon:yes stop_codon:yes gene_type:complete